MRDAAADGLGHPLVVRLSCTQANQHAHHGLMGSLKESTSVFDDFAQIPGSSDQTLKPSSIMMRMYRHYPSLFVRRLGVDAGRVRSFWEQLLRGRRPAWLQEHHYLRHITMDELTYLVPLVLHEDAAPVTKLLSANMLSFSSLLALGSEKYNDVSCASHM